MQQMAFQMTIDPQLYRVIAQKRNPFYAKSVEAYIQKIASVDFIILCHLALKLSENMDLVYVHVNRVQKRI